MTVVEQLEMGKLLQRDEICSLKAQARSLLKHKVSSSTRRSSYGQTRRKRGATTIPGATPAAYGTAGRKGDLSQSWDVYRIEGWGRKRLCVLCFTCHRVYGVAS